MNRMFIIEGAPCIALAILCFIFLPDAPETAKFLNEEERRLEIERIAIGMVLMWVIILD